MAIFCRKKLENPICVGAYLKKTREEKGASLQAISEKTHISLKHLEAIENGRYCDLPPAKAHALAYVRAYSKALGISPSHMGRRFCKEANLENYEPIHPGRTFKIKSMGLSILLKTALGGLAVVAFLVYLSWQIYGIFQSPKLNVYSPSEGFVTSRLSTMVEGVTEKEVSLTVNGKDIMTSEQGRFEAPVDLSSGVNTITITATKKHGKTATITRHVVVNSIASEFKKVTKN